MSQNPNSTFPRGDSPFSGQVRIPQSKLPTAVNPNRKNEEDTRTPEELLNIIEEQGRVISESIKALRSKGITT